MLYPIKKNGKEGYIDADGEIVIEPQYDFASRFSYGIAKVGICPNEEQDTFVLPLWGYINKYGLYMSEPMFDHGFDYSGGRKNIAAEIKGKWGFLHFVLDNHLDTMLQFIIKPTFDDVEPNVSEDYACVKIDNKWGYIDYQKAESSFITNELYGQDFVLDRKLFAIEPKFDDAYNFSEGLARVMVDGYRDPIYDNLNIHSFIKPPLQGKWGFIDKTGKFAIYPQFDLAGNFKEGLAPIKINEKYGYIDKNGNYAIKPQFDDASNFSEGLACVRIEGKYGYINPKGRFIINPTFDTAQNFTDGIAIVKTNDKYHYITKELSSPKYFWQKVFRIFVPKKQKGFDYAEQFKEGFAVIEKNGKYGYINKKGKCVIKPKYEEAHSFIGEVAPVRLNNKFHYINKKGNIIWTNEQFPFIWFEKIV